MTYNDVFSRTADLPDRPLGGCGCAGLVAQATEFDDGFDASRSSCSMVLLLGIGTFIRLGDALTEDAWLLFGMNRIRHAYLEIAPGLEPYFVTGHHDDVQGVMETYGPDAGLRSARILASTPTLVGLIDAVVAGVLAGLVAQVADAGTTLSVLVGVVVTTLAVVLMVVTTTRRIARTLALLVPRFPR